MYGKKMCVRATAGRQVINIDAAESGVLRFVGRKLIVVDGAAAFEANKDPETVPYHPDYERAVREGDLEAADQATADMCGVPFKGAASKKGDS